MRNRDKFWKLSCLLNLRVLYVVSVMIAVLVIVDLSVFRYGGYGSIWSSVYIGKMYGIVKNEYSSNGSGLDNVHVGNGSVKENVNGNGFDKVVFDKEGEAKERKREALLLGKGENGTTFAIEEDSKLRNGFKSEEGLGLGREEDLADLGKDGVSYYQVNNFYYSNGSPLNDALDGHGRVKGIVNGNGFDKVVFNGEEEGKERTHGVLLLGKGENGTSLAIKEDSELYSSFKSEEGIGIGREKDLGDLGNGGVSSSQVKDGELKLQSREEVKDLVGGYDEEIDEEPNTNFIGVDNNNQSSHGSLQIVSSGSLEGNSEDVVIDSGTSVSFNMSSIRQHINARETKPESISLESSPIKTADSFLSRSAVMKKREKVIPISQMNSIFLQNSAASNPVRRLRSSACDRELEKARIEIENAPIVRDVSQVHASVFQNFSMFSRSYQLMERLLKVYVYREGEKPIFHQPYMRGIYASEGWFMKLMEANKQFVVKDAKKAHLFYIPFSSKKLRSAFNTSSFFSHRDLQNHLDNYVGLIAKKYRFWNRTMGTDHFLVGCHDWAPGFTRNKMGNCIRALCNANVARDFKIGKDVSLPVTYIRSVERPLEFVAGSPPSERPILAFFAGGMHGYLRPVLLEYWNDKEPDMKIFGPLPRDFEGKARYREFMKTSRYCICAKGYEVHTPRVVESIYSGCVPVIISDNYVPPFFETLDWEAFSVFILEKDIPNLRSILLSISQEKYITMHQRLISVQQHFLWHKNPQKYDLFHMILHSVWYNRVFQIKHG